MLQVQHAFCYWETNIPPTAIHSSTLRLELLALLAAENRNRSKRVAFMTYCVYKIWFDAFVGFSVWNVWLVIWRRMTRWVKFQQARVHKLSNRRERWWWWWWWCRRRRQIGVRGWRFRFGHYRPSVSNVLVSAVPHFLYVFAAKVLLSGDCIFILPFLTSRNKRFQICRRRWQAVLAGRLHKIHSIISALLEGTRHVASYDILL